MHLYSEPVSSCKEILVPFQTPCLLNSAVAGLYTYVQCYWYFLQLYALYVRYHTEQLAAGAFGKPPLRTSGQVIVQLSLVRPQNVQKSPKCRFFDAYCVVSTRSGSYESPRRCSTGTIVRASSRSNIAQKSSLRPHGPHGQD